MIIQHYTLACHISEKGLRINIQIACYVPICNSGKT